MNKQFSIKSAIQDYEVHFTHNFQHWLVQNLENPCAILIDQTVYQLYESKLLPILATHPVMQVEATETNKALAFIEQVVTFLMSSNFKRNHTLIAIGGGIIQDLTCFVASTLFRGVSWIFYPTTLLAQCDSCIGSKSSLNVGVYKNQMGTFYPPQTVVIDVNFTKTLKHVDLLSGLGEAIKVHYLDEEKRFDAIFTHYPDALSALPTLEQIIYDSLLIKKRIIEIDEYDKDYRNIMNYGHTFGHALESVTNYQIPHGIAVTWGMGMANFLSRQLGYLPQAEYDQMETLVQENTKQVPFKISQLEPFWEALAKDKKNVDHRVNFILTKGFGKMFKKKIALNEEVKSTLTQYLQENAVLA